MSKSFVVLNGRSTASLCSETIASKSALFPLVKRAYKISRYSKQTPSQTERECIVYAVI